MTTDRHATIGAMLDEYALGQLSQRERRDVEARLRIVRDAVHQHADAPHAFALLHARRDRPCCRGAAE